MRSSAGLSLLEVMVASATLATGIFSVFGAMGTSSQVRQRANDQGRAVEAIQTEVEYLQSQSFSNVDKMVPPLNASAGSSFLAFDVSGLTPPVGQIDAGKVQREADSTATRLHLRFTVDWVDAAGPASVVIHYHHINRGG